MLRNILYILTILLCISCSRLEELFDESFVEEGKEVLVRLNYGSDVKDVTVTKAGLTSVQEAAVYSIYVMTFNQDGVRTNNASEALFYRTDQGGGTSGKKWVDESTEGNYSKGYIEFTARSGVNCTVYAVANVNTAELSGVYAISSEDLDEVTTLDELKALTIGLNNKAISRGQRILMYGCLKENESATEAKKVTIESADKTVQTLDGTIFFERTDAKIIFNVTKKDSDIELELHSWQVFNVPLNAPLVPSTELGTGMSEDEGLETFDASSSVQFDSGNSFTFYMLESNLDTKTELTKYAQREAKNKTESGAYELKDGSWTWEYAPEKSTYVQIRGRISQTIAGTGDLVHADFVYNVHLGDFGTSNDDFWVKPNTEYTYNVYVAGVENIRTEVETSNDDTDGVTENQPGAEGSVVVASGGNIHEVDSHYAQLVIPFTYSQTFIEAMGGDNSIDDLTWYVSTPYSEGTYAEGENNPETNHYDDELLDYKWVEFYISHEDKMVTYTEYLKWLHSKGRAQQDGNGYMKTQPLYVMELVEELKTWYKYMNGSSTDKPSLITAGTPETTQKIYVTVFVNEYYYDNGNPLIKSNGVEGDGDIPAMVRKVVNAEDRYMHILSNVDYSLDGASSVTNSAATIIQTPIRSIYNIPDFGKIQGYNLIWGTETVSEKYGNDDGLLYGNINHYNAYDSFNGRYNTGIMWSNQNWSDRMDIVTTTENGKTVHQWTMKNATSANANPAIYACLARNRDENGNDKIDTPEIRWYMAAIDQLQYLYIGEYALHSDAKLLPNSVKEEDANKYKYLSSTYTSNNNGGGFVLWAEEGLSTSGNLNRWDSDPYSYLDYNTGFVRRYVRCLRNLGSDNYTGAAMNTLFDHDGSIISPTYMNTDALRSEKWANPTVVHEDRTSLNLPYVGGFEYESFDRDLSKSNSLYGNIDAGGPCPDGYRIPNQRELALMYIVGIRPSTGYMWSSSYNWYKAEYAFSGITYLNTVTVHYGNDGHDWHVRCIRDVDAANNASIYNDQGSLIN